MAIVVVSNTSPLSNLAAIGELPLLQQLYGTVIVPDAVAQELASAGADEPASAVIATFTWLQVRSLSNTALLNSLAQNLDSGEAAAIALAAELRADRLIIDERRGRRIARDLGIPITGLLGILLAAKQRQLVPRVQPLLDRLVESGFWLRPELYAEILRLANELPAQP